MIISITGTGPRNANKLETAARFFASQLLHPRTVQNLELDIEVRRTLDVHGECVNEDDCRNPRYFTIGLRRQSLDKMIETLAHEMVHVKQYAKNELSKNMRMQRNKDGEPSFVLGSKWMGEWWVPKAKEDEYWDAPWEIEAFGREVGLNHKWVEKFELKGGQ